VNGEGPIRAGYFESDDQNHISLTHHQLKKHLSESKVTYPSYLLTYNRILRDVIDSTRFKFGKTQKNIQCGYKCWN